jgi:sugar diacid utilization regulator
MERGDTHEHVAAHVARIITAVRDQEESIADAMVVQLASRIAVFAGDERAAMRAQMRKFCSAHVRLFLDVAATGRSVEVAEMPFMPEPRWVEEGVSLEDVLQAFRLGHRCVWDAILASAGQDATGAQAALELARPSMDYIDVVSSAVAYAYLQAQQSVTADRDRSRHELLNAILEDRFPLSGVLRAQAIADGLEPPVPYVVAVAAVDRGASHAQQQQIARAIQDRVAKVCSGVLLVTRADELVFLLAPRGADLQQLRDVLRSSVRRLSEDRNIAVALGMSTSAIGLEVARLAYREAQRALSWALPGPAIVALPFVSVFDYLVASADDTARHIPSLADPLFGEPAIGFARDTLQSYFDSHLNVRKAAERLGIHANTMHYRLRRIAEITGCDLRDFNSLVELLIAIRLHERPFGAERDRREEL